MQMQVSSVLAVDPPTILASRSNCTNSAESKQSSSIGAIDQRWPWTLCACRRRPQLLEPAESPKPCCAGAGAARPRPAVPASGLWCPRCSSASALLPETDADASSSWGRRWKDMSLNAATSGPAAAPPTVWSYGLERSLMAGGTAVDMDGARNVAKMERISYRPRSRTTATAPVPASAQISKPRRRAKPANASATSPPRRRGRRRRRPAGVDRVEPRWALLGLHPVLGPFSRPPLTAWGPGRLSETGNF
jgi:hypothetical protein